VLHACNRQLPPQHATCETFYLVRRRPGPLAAAELREVVDYGVLPQGPSLKSLEQLLSKVMCRVSCCQRCNVTELSVLQEGDDVPQGLALSGANASCSSRLSHMSCCLI
jgi:hypothetical protein